MAHQYKSLGTLGLSTVLILLWLLGWITTPEGEGDPFSMSASNIILVHIRPWVYLTSGFYNPSIFQLIPIVIATILLGMRVEPELGTGVMLRMIFFANIATTFCIFCDIFILYIIFRVPTVLYTHVASFSGGIMCLLVAWIRAQPNARVGGIHLRLWPLFICTSLFIVSLLGFKSSVICSLVLPVVPYSLGGWFFGWYYLRFLQHHSDGSVGHKCESFAVVVFFPDFLRPCISPIANFSISVIQLCGYLKDWSKTDVQLPITSKLDPVSERRIARAKKALDCKLAKLAESAPSTETVESTDT